MKKIATFILSPPGILYYWNVSCPFCPETLLTLAGVKRCFWGNSDLPCFCFCTLEAEDKTFCSSYFTQPFAWQWLALSELGPPAYSNLAGFCSESVIQRQDRRCIWGVEQSHLYSIKEREVPRAPSSCLSQYLGLQQIDWRWEVKLITVLTAVDGMAWHYPCLPTCTSVLWRKYTKACETYAEITMLCQLQWAGSCCLVRSVNTLYCAGKLWGLAVFVCLLLSLCTGGFSCVSVWKKMSICCMAFLGARRKIFNLAFLVSCCKIVTRHSTLWSRLLTTSRAGAGRLTLSQMERDVFP